MTTDSTDFKSASSFIKACSNSSCSCYKRPTLVWFLLSNFSSESTPVLGSTSWWPASNSVIWLSIFASSPPASTTKTLQQRILHYDVERVRKISTSIIWRSSRMSRVMSWRRRRWKNWCSKLQDKICLFHLWTSYSNSYDCHSLSTFAN